MSTIQLTYAVRPAESFALLEELSDSEKRRIERTEGLEKLKQQCAQIKKGRIKMQLEKRRRQV